MRAINHALTGAIIGLTIPEPIVAVPLAVVSHYVCDAIPHYGANIGAVRELRSKLFRNLLYLDAGLCIGLVMVLAVTRPQHWLLAAICAFAAAVPDMLSLPTYIKIRRRQPWQDGLYAKFAHRIQWFEKPIGAVVDLAWFAAAVIIILPFLR